MPKRVLEGIVVSNKMEKTVVVRVERQVQHPLYKKIIKKSKKYLAHDESNSIEEGTKIKILESKPYSKRKKWEVIVNN
ncbi:30S ribosomal protein S17 [Candidatus Hepatincola sp. Pdp]